MMLSTGDWMNFVGASQVVGARPSPSVGVKTFCSLF